MLRAVLAATLFVGTCIAIAPTVEDRPPEPSPDPAHVPAPAPSPQVASGQVEDAGADLCLRGNDSLARSHGIDARAARIVHRVENRTTHIDGDTTFATIALAGATGREIDIGLVTNSTLWRREACTVAIHAEGRNMTRSVVFETLVERNVSLRPDLALRVIALNASGVAVDPMDVFTITHKEVTTKLFDQTFESDADATLAALAALDTPRERREVAEPPEVRPQREPEDPSPPSAPPAPEPAWESPAPPTPVPDTPPRTEATPVVVAVPTARQDPAPAESPRQAPPAPAAPTPGPPEAPTPQEEAPLAPAPTPSAPPASAEDEGVDVLGLVELPLFS